LSDFKAKMHQIRFPPLGELMPQTLAVFKAPTSKGREEGDIKGTEGGRARGGNGREEGVREKCEARKLVRSCIEDNKSGRNPQEQNRSAVAYHRLNGSSSPLLTAICLSYGSFCDFLTFSFRNTPGGQTPQPIFTQNGSTTWIHAQMCLLE